MLQLNRNHVADISTNNKLVTWETDCFVRSEKSPTGFVKTALIEPFALDVWTAQHGFEVWSEADGKRTRKTILAPVSEPLPAKPEGGVAIYLIAIYSTEIGINRHDLLVKGAVTTEAVCDLFDLLAPEMINKTPKVPVVIYTIVPTDLGCRPVFEIAAIDLRPARWGKPTVSFN